MIRAVGTDLVDCGRLERRLTLSSTLGERLWTEYEREVCAGRLSSLAGRLAVKEAVLKALGAILADADTPPPRGWRYHDIAVTTPPGVAPRLTLGGVVAACAHAQGISRWHVSISHDGGMASAVVLAEGDDGAAR